MKKIILVLLFIFSLFPCIAYANEIDQHPNFKVIDKKPLSDYAELFIFQEGMK
jgi:hypothetical protein